MQVAILRFITGCYRLVVFLVRADGSKDTIGNAHS
jgi:hypothetical protein